ncbi:hypothetical protein C2I18_26890 [Paenibacillus sp. PK3_47]|uniref:hypothetical protein n=1 Tax=Paenibacillus sp. PK3_47 TaxID=2072642 RepID=UPI00201D9408|nr:hypothetical protein [Paenibacillus sp. PK3_47]UQZ36838.1 hypothetical protein C2I18_26890 [Paenibacillus sp. PK3_47]
MSEIKYPVKTASRMGTVIGMILITSIQCFNVWRLWDSQREFFFYASLTAICICVGVMLISLYITFLKKPTELCLSNEQMIFNGKVMKPKDIKMIMIRGYFKPVIGILPHGRMLVPMDMAFRYSKDEEDKAIADLKSWAAMNDVEMDNKYFQTWI